MARPRRLLLLTLATVCVCACGGAGAPPGGPDAGAPPPDLAPACSEPAGGRPDGAVCPASVSGRVVDEAGRPVPDIVITYCAEGCFFGKTDADGSFTVTVSQPVLLARYALSLHGRPERASYYWHLPPFSGDRFVAPSPLLLPALPSDGPLLAVDGKAQTVTANGVTLELPDGAGVQLDIEDFAEGERGRRFRPLRASPPTLLPFVDGASPPLALWVFTPFEVVFSRPARLSFPNTTGLAAGAAVDLHAQRSLLTGPPPAGDFERVAGGTVTPDGQRIEMDPGEGVSSLTWIAIRRKGG